MTARTDLHIPQGTTWAYAWRITGYDLTGTTWTARSQVRRSPRDEHVLHELEAAFDGTDLVAVMAGATISSAWDWTSGVYDLELHADDGRVLRIAAGSVRVDLEVTRNG